MAEKSPNKNSKPKAPFREKEVYHAGRGTFTSTRVIDPKNWFRPGDDPDVIPRLGDLSSPKSKERGGEASQSQIVNPDAPRQGGGRSSPIVVLDSQGRPKLVTEPASQTAPSDIRDHTSPSVAQGQMVLGELHASTARRGSIPWPQVPPVEIREDEQPNQTAQDNLGLGPGGSNNALGHSSRRRLSRSATVPIETSSKSNRASTATPNHLPMDKRGSKRSTGVSVSRPQDPTSQQVQESLDGMISSILSTQHFVGPGGMQEFPDVETQVAGPASSGQTLSQGPQSVRRHNMQAYHFAQGFADVGTQLQESKIIRPKFPNWDATRDSATQNNARSLTRSNTISSDRFEKGFHRSRHNNHRSNSRNVWAGRSIANIRSEGKRNSSGLDQREKHTQTEPKKPLGVGERADEDEDVGYASGTRSSSGNQRKRSPNSKPKKRLGIGEREDDSDEDSQNASSSSQPHAPQPSGPGMSSPWSAPNLLPIRNNPHNATYLGALGPILQTLYQAWDIPSGLAPQSLFTSTTDPMSINNGGTNSQLIPVRSLLDARLPSLPTFTPIRDRDGHFPLPKDKSDHLVSADEAEQIACAAYSQAAGLAMNGSGFAQISARYGDFSWLRTELADPNIPSEATRNLCFPLGEAFLAVVYTYMQAWEQRRIVLWPWRVSEGRRTLVVRAVNVDVAVSEMLAVAPVEAFRGRVMIAGVMMQRGRMS